MSDGTLKKKKGLSRQTLLLIVFTVVVIGGGGYYYATNFAPQTSESVVELGTKRQLQIKRVDWKKAVYEHETLQSLKNPLPEPLKIGPIGNPNPFAVRIAPEQGVR